MKTIPEFCEMLESQLREEREEMKPGKVYNIDPPRELFGYKFHDSHVLDWVNNYQDKTGHFCLCIHEFGMVFREADCVDQ